MSAANAPVVIVGAGLAGLACALELRASGRPCLVLEASDRPGGRVRTDAVDGPGGRYLIDRGFQVYLDGYPEGRRVLDHGALGLGAFRAGADVARTVRRPRVRAVFTRVSDPRRSPVEAAGAWPGVATLGDGLKLLALHRSLTSGSDEDAMSREPDVPALDRLRSAGVSDRAVERFFRPFFGGVFLDPSLATSARMLRLTYRNFARGRAVLPEGGMGAIAGQLASKVGGPAIRTGARVEGVDPAGAVLACGERVEASAVVVATDGETAGGLLGVGWRAGEGLRWRRTATVAFAAASSPRPGRRLVLDGEGAGPVNHLAVPSDVRASYAPPGRSVVYANVVHDRWLDRPDGALVAAVRGQLGSWFGRSTAGAMEVLRVVRIDRAIPEQHAGWLEPARGSVAVAAGGGTVYRCGDWLDNASINGALESGRRAARAVLEV